MGQNKKYPVLYVQRFSDHDFGTCFDAYELEHRKVAVGTETLTDLLDELYKLREEKDEWEGSKETIQNGRGHSDRPDEGKGK